jgi:hypothetical protein
MPHFYCILQSVDGNINNYINIEKNTTKGKIIADATKQQCSVITLIELSEDDIEVFKRELEE